VERIGRGSVTNYSDLVKHDSRLGPSEWKEQRVFLCVRDRIRYSVKTSPTRRRSRLLNANRFRYA
jgi:hypothetical protein